MFTYFFEIFYCSSTCAGDKAAVHTSDQPPVRATVGQTTPSESSASLKPPLPQPASRHGQTGETGNHEVLYGRLHIVNTRQVQRGCQHIEVRTNLYYKHVSSAMDG